MILVDGITEYETTLRHKRWSHMVSDVDANELHAFAQALGLSRAWSQERPKSSAHHYDITPGKRAIALARGAVSVSSRELVLRNYDGFQRRGLRSEPTKDLGLEAKLGPITAMILAKGLTPTERTAFLVEQTRVPKVPARIEIKWLPMTCRKHPRVEIVDSNGKPLSMLLGGHCPLCIK